MPVAALQPMIRLRGVRHNNLKHFDLDLPLHRLIVFTGLSGSGKSSLAFDTLFAEGQRRYIETFSPYARQFFDRMDKPQVDSIEGIPPAIAIEQRNAVRTTRSTVGTMTELCDYMKAIWPHIAQLHCRQCGRPVSQDPPLRVWETLYGEHPGADALVVFDVRLSARLALGESLKLISGQGYQRVLIEGQVSRIDESADKLEIGRSAAVTVVQDRVQLVPSNRVRFVEACEQAYHFGHGTLTVHVSQSGGGTRRAFSIRRHCPACNIEYPEPTPALFSFNHPLGACPTCRGFGRVITIDFDRAIPDRSRTLAEGAIKPWRSGMGLECQADLLKFCRARGVPVNVPFRDLPTDQQRWVVDGDEDYATDESHQWPHAWYGVKGYFRWLESKAYKMHVRVLLSKYRSYQPCPDCRGARLKQDALLYRLAAAAPGSIGACDAGVAPARPDSTHANRHVTVKAQDAVTTSEANSFAGLTLADFYRLPIRDSQRHIGLLAARHRPVPGDPLGIALADVKSRLDYLVEAGLGYLTLDRPTRTLSGGEVERVNLTACLGTRLVNTLFVLDEPSVGLHPRDTSRLIRLLERLRDAGNTVVVVEHEAAVIRAADEVVDLGPGSGERGGNVVFQGSYAGLLGCHESLTGRYLSGQEKIRVTQRRPVRPSISRSVRQHSGRVQYAPSCEDHAFAALADALPGASCKTSGSLRDGDVPWLVVVHATRHNLKDITVGIPLGRLVCITGVSGSGKTTLIKEVLLPALEEKLGDARSGQSDHGQEPDPEDRSEADTGRATGAEVRGWENVERAVMIDQSPIGRTPRSNPAIYVGAFDEIRKLYAGTVLASQRSYSPGVFSFNTNRGRCVRCGGAGFEKIEMQFLSDVYVRCPDCDGKRFSPEVLEVVLVPPRPTAPDSGNVLKGRNIAELLDLTVDEAVEFLGTFSGDRHAHLAVERLQVLRQIGLGYLRLGQPINTLSGGESQRLKLAGQLVTTVSTNGMHPARTAGMAEDALRALIARKRHGTAVDATQPANGQILFLLDEPTKGLHFDDVRVLLGVFQRLVDAGHSVVVIEHNLDVIRRADWVIDLGPEAGDEGGRIVVEGTPEEVAACEASHTGRALREML